ncbi:hypothetical protein PYCCODRAFT_1209623 [Trametes coccinea BRFM310]|uniref:Uncharacterized protein n=1 Tax=Trametes coccinea (strain BRFM310) TaxID=1353009 RepID=A0A1Y2I8D3_TRAC3|nr:hypothetical protein PYCCODRAFT_1209623 [Trametes coccinea BRFM310]
MERSQSHSIPNNTLVLRPECIRSPTTATITEFREVSYIIPRDLPNIATPFEKHFIVPDRFPESGASVTYAFKGVDGSVVSITASCSPFLMGYNPTMASERREGLITFSTKMPQNEAIFGMNWFNTMFVGMHKGSLQRDHVLLAPQTIGDIDKYVLPLGLEAV